MRLIFSLTIILLFFTSCSNNLSIPNIKSTKSLSKAELISKANMGDIKAMIQLNKEYIFPKTKEGFDYFNKWYPLVLQSKNSKDIMAFAEIFYEYKDMFLSGKIKYVQLLEAASNEKFKEPLFKLLEIYMFAYDHKKINVTEAKILNNASKDDLYTLYDFYVNKYKKEDAKKIEKILVQKDYSIPPTKDFLQLKNIINRKRKKDEISKLLNNILISDNYEYIIQTAYLLEYRRRYKEAKPYYEKAIKLKDNDGNTYLKYANLYKKLISHYRVLHGKDAKYKNYQNEEIATLKKAIKYGEDKAYIELLKIYSKEKYYKSDYNLLIEELSI